MEPLSGLERLGAEARRAQDASADRALDLGAARRRFLAEPVPVRRRPAAAWFAAATLAAALVLGVGLFFGRPLPPLAFRVGDAGRPGVVDAWLAAGGEGPLSLRFSDGSEVRLAPSSRARVTRLDAKGATVRLEGGRLAVAVAKRKGAAWQVSLGPFRIDVTGTKFAVDWDPAGERLGLSMHEGSVLVSGCVFGGGHAFVAGDTVTASCRDGRIAISSKPAGGEEAAPSPPVPEPSGLPVPLARPSADSRPPPAVAPVTTGEGPALDARSAAAPRATAPDWRKLASSGQYAQALDAAEAVGFGEECNHASAADLVTLGDAARYSGRFARARDAYSAVRRRFPRDERAAVAAFALGRLSADQLGDQADAASWFRTYLAEHPEGRLARDALGRLVEALQRGGDTAGARREARRYLDHYPDGPHAEVARRVIAN
jgi:transmembrane sensor